MKLPALVHPEWREAYPWLLQGTTTAGVGGSPFDLGLFSDASPPLTVLENWEHLRVGVGLPELVCAHQIHGAAVRFHRAGPPGLHVAERCDGHAATDPGVTLAVTVADCVPVFLVDPERGGLALLHAGWRGAAAGILERGLELLVERAGSRPQDVRVHLGPAICGTCYEVGPEVFEALGLDVPAASRPVDLRYALGARAVAKGAMAENVSVSGHCTRCGHAGLFSHRGGNRERQAAFLGMRP